jgi:outer membrane protein
MTSKLVRLFVSAAFAISLTALAQTDSSAALPSAPSAAPSSPVVASGSGTKIGTINIEQAIFASNEGQRDFDTLSKKLEPKQTELKGQNDELESLKKQLNNDKITEESRGTLVKQIEQKQKSLERSVQDARDDAQNQQGEIAQRILQKMAPILVKYAGDNGFGLIIDVTKPWPDGPVLWAGPSIDITKPVVEAYNAQSGVAAPVNSKPATLRPTTPGASKPAGTATKPAAPAATKPATPTTKP